jgi:hypothetical protein
MGELDCPTLEMKTVVDNPRTRQAATTGFDIFDAESCSSVDFFQCLAHGCL